MHAWEGERDVLAKGALAERVQNVVAPLVERDIDQRRRFT